MNDLMQDDNNSNIILCGVVVYVFLEYSAYAIPFMVTYIIFVKYVMLNLFILVLIEQFSTS